MITADEIDNLDGPELDALVAEHVMGWKWLDMPDERVLISLERHRGSVLLAGVVIGGIEKRVRYTDNLPKYSQHTACSVLSELIEKAREYVCPQDADAGFTIMDCPGGWWVGWTWHEMEYKGGGLDECLELAVCRFALKAALALQAVTP